MPSLSGERDYDWVNEIVGRTMAEIPAGVERAWHFCMGNAWGNKLEGMTAGGYREILPHYHGAAVDAYVLDFACREMADADLLRALPADKRVHAGVIDVRTLEIEHPEQVAERVRKVLAHIEPERVTLTTDCGLKQLPRPCAVQKLRALTQGAAIVRRELGG
jgi:5-methyltetrahydropteroyltriglutamate--homocysteine methyltransferase